MLSTAFYICVGVNVTVVGLLCLAVHDSDRSDKWDVAVLTYNTRLPN